MTGVRGPGPGNGLFEELWLEALEISSQGNLPVHGDSMLPALAPGQRVVVERLPADRYRVGDVVVFRGEASLVAHRLVGAFRAGGTPFVVQKGDNDRLRSALPRHRLLGRVVAVLRPDGSRVPVASAPPPPHLRLYYTYLAYLRRQARRMLGRILHCEGPPA